MKSFKLEGAALVLAEALCRAGTQHNENLNSLKRQMELECQRAGEEFRLICGEILRVSEIKDVQASQVSVDTRYLAEHGVAFVHVPEEVDLAMAEKRNAQATEH